MIQCYEIKGYTDRKVTANTPDIIIKNKKDKTRISIDVEIPAERNVMQKEAGKKLNYRSLCMEIRRMGNRKCMIVPVIIGATGMATKGLKKVLKAIPGKHSIDTCTPQNTAVLGISHIIRKVLQSEITMKFIPYTRK